MYNDWESREAAVKNMDVCTCMLEAVQQIIFHFDKDNRRKTSNAFVQKSTRPI
jgi:hypothetical protein